MIRIVLASASARRLDLLRQIGLDPLVVPAEVDEALPSPTSAPDAAQLLAQAKAEAVRERMIQGQSSLAAEHPLVILAADTVIDLDGETLGKPRDEADAHAMLARLSGREHRVRTGVSLIDSREPIATSAIATTTVTMRPLDTEEIAAYVATGEGADAAGAYAIQGRAGVFVTGIEGDYYNVVGLPLALVADLLAKVGLPVHRLWGPQ